MRGKGSQAERPGTLCAAGFPSPRIASRRSAGNDKWSVAFSLLRTVVIPGEHRRAASMRGKGTQAERPGTLCAAGFPSPRTASRRSAGNDKWSVAFSLLRTVVIPGEHRAQRRCEARGARRKDRARSAQLGSLPLASLRDARPGMTSGVWRSLSSAPLSSPASIGAQRRCEARGPRRKDRARSAQLGSLSLAPLRDARPGMTKWSVAFSLLRTVVIPGEHRRAASMRGKGTQAERPGTLCAAGFPSPRVASRRSAGNDSAD